MENFPCFFGGPHISREIHDTATRGNPTSSRNQCIRPHSRQTDSQYKHHCVFKPTSTTPSAFLFSSLLVIPLLTHYYSRLLLLSFTMVTSTRRTIPASTAPSSYSSSPCGVQGIVRTRVSKRRRGGATVAKNLKLALATADINNLPPCSPVSTAPPSPSLPSTTITITKPSMTTLPPLEDRLSLSYVPVGPLVGREEEERSIRASIEDRSRWVQAYLGELCQLKEAERSLFEGC